jgi:hypothetical protein
MANEKKKTLRELFHDTPKDIYFAEKKILGALPKMAKAAQAHDLKAAFEKHEAGDECSPREGLCRNRSGRSRKNLRGYPRNHGGRPGSYEGIQGYAGS